MACSSGRLEVAYQTVFSTSLTVSGGSVNLKYGRRLRYMKTFGPTATARAGILGV